MITLRQNRLLLLVAGIIFAAGLAVATWYLFNQKITPDTAAVVNGAKITKEDVLQRVWFDTYFVGELKDLHPSNEQSQKAIDYLIDAELTRQGAQKLGLNVTDEEAINEIKKINSQVESYKDPKKSLVLANSRTTLLQKRIGDKVTSWRKGEYLSVPFDRFYKDNPSQYSKDKDYAKSLADKYYEELKKGKSFNSAITELEEDARLGTAIRVKGNWGKVSYGGYIGRDASLDGSGYIHVTNIPGFKDYIDGLPKGTLQPPKLMKFVLPSGLRDDVEKGETAEGTWVIVKVTESNSGNYTSYKAWFSELKSNSKIQRYM